MVPKKFTSYRGQGESGLQRFPGKIFKEITLRFFSGIASNNKQVWIEIECHVYLTTDVPPGTNARN